MDRALAILRPLDALRQRLLALFAPFARNWIVDRERRVALSFVVVVTTSLALATTMPLVLLALGPILLGVPHLVSDVRYLVVREGLHRRATVWGAVLGPLVALAITADVRWGWGAMIGAALVARGSIVRRAILSLVGVGFYALASRHAFLTGLAMAHFHNLFAVMVLWVWRPKELKISFVAVAFYAAACLFFVSGAYAPILAAAHGTQTFWTGLDIGDQAHTFAPPDVGALGSHLVVFFAFAQSVHYGLWLRLVPDEARPSKTPRSFRQSARALVADLGAPLVLVAVALAIGLAVWAAFDLLTARDRYFRFAMFHGYLEFAAFTLFFCEGSVTRAARDAAAPRKHESVVVSETDRAA